MKVIKLSVWFFIAMIVLTSCTKYRESIDIPKGVFKQEILVRSEPTEAMVYINGRRVGETPFRTDLMYSEKRMINVKAVPIYPNQFTQNIFLSCPPIPETMTIYMNEKPAFEFKDDDDDKIKPPKKREPIIQIEHDTIYVDKIDYYTTPTIFFDLDEIDIRADQKHKLKLLASFLKQKREFYIDIVGSADVRGSDDYNIKLSLDRAKEVANYLVRRGVRSDRIITKALGESLIYNEDEQPLEYQASRSVIFELYYDKRNIKTMEERNEVLKTDE